LQRENPLQSRAQAVQAIEKTIMELGGIFQQLATMVSEQVHEKGFPNKFTIK
jgi:t-SNARE complex subunit (syntaxin)